MTAIQITIPLIFSVVAIVMCFFRRMPACILAFAAFLSAGLLGVMHVSVEQYVIWGFIAVADTVNIYATRMVPGRTMQLYTVVGCLAGFLIGWIGGTVAMVMIAGAVGAILGFLAYTRTPKGRMPGMPLSHRLSLLAGAACTAWFSFVMVSIVLSALFA